MTTKHTPEPWKYTEELRAQFSVVSGGGVIVAGIPNPIEGIGNFALDLEETRANAARIVACVNACEGIADPEAVPELVSLCEVILATAPQTGAGALPLRIERELRAALAKAKGGPCEH